MDQKSRWLDWAVELQSLALEKNNEEQISMCFDAHHAENWKTLFD